MTVFCVTLYYEQMVAFIHADRFMDDACKNKGY